MTTWSLLFTAAFVVVVAFISMWQRLDLERDLLIGAVRAAVQLIAVGYVLFWVFELESWPAMAAMLAVMVAVATRHAARRGQGLPAIWWRVLAAIVASEVITMGLMLVLRIIPPTPRYVISLSGMVIGNAMIVAGLLLNRLQSEMTARRSEVEVWLALGAAPGQAAGDVLKSAVKASMIPSVDALKTVGLVQLPGMMTGQILAGANPIQAVQYQILIMYAIAAAAAVCSITLGRLSLPLFFNRDAQLARETPAAARRHGG